MYIPRIEQAVADVSELLELADTLEADRATGTIEGLFGDALGPILGSTPHGAITAALAASPERFALSAMKEMGIDTAGSAVVIPSQATSGPALIAFELRDRRRFSAALEQLGDEEKRRVDIGAESALVLAPSSDHPIACLARQEMAYCQLGVAAGQNALAPLRALVSPAGPPLGAFEGLATAFGRLAPGGHAYALVTGETAGRRVAELTSAYLEKNRRFEKGEVPGARARSITKARDAAEAVSAAALGVYPTRGGVRADFEVAVSDRGAKILKDLAPEEPRDGVISRWFETPALARVLLAVRGGRAERLLALGGFEVPAGTLSGELALLLFGVDPECSAAKHPSTGPLGWAFLLPSAIAAGVREHPPLDVLEGQIRRTLAREVPAMSELELQTTSALAGQGSEGRMLSGRAFGSAFEVHLYDGLALLGTGPGSGAAAVRRLGALPEAREAGSAPRPFFVAAIHPRAIDAAFEAGTISRENRRELRALDDLRRRTHLWLQQFESIRLEARAYQSERRVALALEIER